MVRVGEWVWDRASFLSRAVISAGAAAAVLLGGAVHQAVFAAAGGLHGAGLPLAASVLAGFGVMLVTGHGKVRVP